MAKRSMVEREKRRILLETLGEVLEGPNKIILDDSGNGQGVVPYLPLNELKNNKVNNWWILNQEIS